MVGHHIEEALTAFLHKNLAKKPPNAVYSLAMLACVLAAAAWSCHSIEDTAGRPSSDTVFYRLIFDLERLDCTFKERAWNLLRQHKEFWRRERQKYVAIDETHESYTGKKRGGYIHPYKPARGCTGSFRFLVFSLVTPHRRLVLRAVPILQGQDTVPLIITTLQEIRREVSFRAALFDRGFYDGAIVAALQQHNIPFIIRARLSATMHCMLQSIVAWTAFAYALGETPATAGVPTMLVLGKDEKGRSWGFLTNIPPQHAWRLRSWYRKRWALENIFQITDGIHLSTNSTRIEIKTAFFLASLVLYNAWQWTRTASMTLRSFVHAIITALWQTITHIVHKPPLQIALLSC